jgi:oligopeptide transport system substrate-binding protein
MIKKTFSIFTISFIALSLLNFQACTKKSDGVAEIKYRLPGDPPSLDWTLATDNVSKEVIVNLMEGLVDQSADSQIQPAMATSWTISPDGKTYTFTLASGITWSDGKALTAAHYVDSWERLLNPKTASEYAYFLFDIEGAEDYQAAKNTDFTKVGVKALNDTTLEVKLRAPVAYWINIPTFWVTFPIRKDIVEKFGDKWTDPANIVTAGSYLLKSYERDSKVVLERNPNYYKTAKIAEMPPRLVFRVVKDDSTAVSLFNNGDLDIVRDLPPVQIPNLSTRPEFVASPYLRGFYIGFNVKDPQVADPKVRQALAHAIDRSELKKILGALITPAKTWNQPTLIGYDANIGIDFNAEAAKKLWSELKTKPASIEFWYDQKEMNRLVAENLQAQWKRNLGVEVTLQNMEWKVYLKTLQAKAPGVFRMGWGADYPDPDTFLGLFTCKSGNNNTGFCNKEYDDLINAAKSATSAALRGEQYAKAEKILLEKEVAIIPLFSQTNMHLVSPKVLGFRVNPMGDFVMREFKVKTQELAR